MCKGKKFLRILNLFFLSSWRDKKLTHSINDSIELLGYYVLNSVTSFHYLCIVKFFHQGINTQRVRHIETKESVSVNVFLLLLLLKWRKSGEDRISVTTRNIAIFISWRDFEWAFDQLN